MGSVSDRSNPKYFLPLGLLLSSALMAAFGLYEAFYGSLTAIIVVMAANGWVQGMGWPPSGKSMVHWFSTRERGTVVSTWNVAHNVGGALVANLALLGVILFQDWGAKFYFNALIAALIAISVFFVLEDTPQSRGLPPVEKYKDDFPPGYSEAHEETLPFREIFLRVRAAEQVPVGDRDRECLLLLRALRRRELDPDLPRDRQGILVPRVEHRLVAVRVRRDPGHHRLRLALRPLVPGQRAPMTMIFMALTLVAVVVYWMNLRGPIWIDYASLFAIGFLDLRADHDDRPAFARPRAEEGGRHGGGAHGPVRLRVRLGDRRARASAGSPTAGTGAASSSPWWPAASSRSPSCR